MEGKMENQTFLISVIVPMYNAEEHIYDCIMQIIHQTYQNFEIILINDGSTDDTEKVCLELQKHYPQIRYYYQQNLGAGAARNKGIEVCKGDYIAFVDADDYLSSEYFEELISLIIKLEVQLSCCSCIKGPQKNVEKFLRNRPLGNTKELSQKEAIASLFYRKEIRGYPVIKLIEATLIRQAKFPTDLRLGEDFIFVYELLKNVDQVAYTSKELYYYVQNSKGITHNVKAVDMKLLWERLKMIMENEIQNESITLKKAVESKLFVTAYDFLIRLHKNKEEEKFRHQLIDYMKQVRMNVVKDNICKPSNRLLGIFCCISIKLVVEAGCLLQKKGMNLKRAL